MSDAGDPGGGLVLCAPNAFKGSLDAAGAALAMSTGASRAAGVAAEALPVADGGDGTLDVLLAAAGRRGRIAVHRVCGPLGSPVEARLGWAAPGQAVVELAEAAGMRRLGRRPDTATAMLATSRGCGELIRLALAEGAEHIIVGLGGSACSDGGAGLLEALGLRLEDGDGRPLGLGGGALAGVASADAAGIDRRLGGCRLEVACDVTAPLLGEHGAAAAFSPQKGAGAAEVARLGAAHERLAGILERDCGAPLSARTLPGAGAAGGCGYALAAICGAALLPGAPLVCDAVGLDARLAASSLVLTGEGRLDATTLAGKAPVEVGRRAARAGIPCVAIAGTVALDAAHPFAGVRALAGPGGIDPREAMSRTAELLEAVAFEVVSGWLRGSVSRPG